MNIDYNFFLQLNNESDSKKLKIIEEAQKLIVEIQGSIPKPKKPLKKIPLTFEAFRIKHNLKLKFDTPWISQNFYLFNQKHQLNECVTCEEETLAYDRILCLICGSVICGEVCINTSDIETDIHCTEHHNGFGIFIDINDTTLSIMLDGIMIKLSALYQTKIGMKINRDFPLVEKKDQERYILNKDLLEDWKQVLLEGSFLERYQKEAMEHEDF